MGSVHQFSEALDVACLKPLHRFHGTRIFINGVPCPADQCLVSDRILMRVEFFRCECAQRRRVDDRIQPPERLFAFRTALIVLGIRKSPLLVGAGDHDPKPVHLKRRIVVIERRAVQKDRAVFLPHGDRELVHDAAVHAVVMILGILPQKRDILIGHRKSEQCVQNDAHAHLDGGGGREPGGIGDVPDDVTVQTGRKAQSELCLISPDHAHRVIRITFLGIKIQEIQRTFDHPCVFEIAGVETDPAVPPSPCREIGADRQRRGKHMSAIVVGVFSDEIHPAGREHEDGFPFFSSEYLVKCF